MSEKAVELEEFTDHLVKEGQVGEFFECLVGRTDVKFIRDIFNKVMYKMDPELSKGDSRPEYMRHY